MAALSHANLINLRGPVQEVELWGHLLANALEARNRELQVRYAERLRDAAIRTERAIDVLLAEDDA